MSNFVTYAVLIAIAVYMAYQYLMKKHSSEDLVEAIDDEDDRDGRPFRHLTVRAFDPLNNIFHLQSESGENRLGMCFQGDPLLGADERTMGQLKSALSNRFTPGTIIHVGLFSEPDIRNQMASYVGGKTAPSPILQEMAFRRADFLTRGVIDPLKGMSNVHQCRQRIIVAVSILCDAQYTEKQKLTMIDYGSQVKEGLSSTGLYLSPMDEDTYLALIRKFFHLYEKDDFDTDDYTPTREQVFSPSDSFEEFDKYLHFNKGESEYFAKLIAVKHFPKIGNIGLMNQLIGDPFGSRNQITTPFYMSSTIVYPDQHAKASALRNKHVWITNQCFGPIAKMVPKLAQKKRDIDVMIHEMEVGGAVLAEFNFTMTMFGRTLEQVQNASAAFTAWAGSFQFEVKEDSRILKEMFFTQLPMNTVRKGIKNTFRFKSLAISHVIRLLPLIGEWTGVSKADDSNTSSVFCSRRGPLVSFDPYASQTNYSGTIIAEPGAGKSVLLQQLIMDWLGEGARVWAIEQGRSLYKTCKIFSGQYIEFSEKSKICLNPFTKVKNIDDEMAILKTIIAKMASPEQGLDDFRLAALESKIKAAYEDAGTKANITLVAENCLTDPDQRIVDIGRMLYTFTRQGSYGHWFDGENNIDLSNDFVVLELQDLANMPTLQQVVLVQLFSNIGDEMYGNDGRKKFLVIDEAKQLIEDPVIGKALDAAYQKVRKHEGAVWMAVQNIYHLLNSPNGQSIIGNSAWQIILQQKTDSIEAAVRNGGLFLDPYQERILKSIHSVPGSYSEFLIRHDENWGVARLIMDRFSQILTSTKGWERHELLAGIDEGRDVLEMINGYIAEGR